MNTLKIDRDALELARKQFCLDIGLPWEEFETDPGQKVYIRKAVYREDSFLNGTKGARNYLGRDDFFHAIICLGQLFLVVDEQLYDWAAEQFGDCAPEWFCEYGNLRKIDEKLKEYDHRIKDTHVYFLPEKEEVPGAAGTEEGIGAGAAESAEGSANDMRDVDRCFQWYNQEEILRFQEKNRFTSAICFSETQPDMLAVAALREEAAAERICEKPFDQSRMTGMAGVSADGEYLWQIGINVDAEERGKGLAAKLVRMLKDRVLAAGKIPFYGTSESHSISQTVGLKAGFVPAWAEVFAEKFAEKR